MKVVHIRIKENKAIQRHQKCCFCSNIRNHGNILLTFDHSSYFHPHACWLQTHLSKTHKQYSSMRKYKLLLVDVAIRVLQGVKESKTQIKTGTNAKQIDMLVAESF
jgi:hypothetical protein